MPGRQQQRERWTEIPSRSLFETLDIVRVVANVRVVRIYICARIILFNHFAIAQRLILRGGNFSARNLTE